MSSENKKPSLTDWIVAVCSVVMVLITIVEVMIK